LTRFQAFLVRSSAVSLAIFAASASVAWAQPAAEDKAQPSAPATTSNFSRLVDPALAEKLKLSDEQRIKIANLQTERTEALAKAAPDQRATVLADFEQKLLALLNDDQRAELSKPDAAEPKLRFSFRFQRWSDVLEWFAEQANLSLVIDAPPPGTFNYSDNRDYTVSEALDLLNGVLLTKGYTLIRRDRMLTVVNLADGVPEALVPRITLADLESRGRFEIVSMLFPVGKRDVEEVVKEIAPLLGPRGKSQPLTKTKQILVTDTAGVMRAINAVIESIPQPEKPLSEEKAEKPELVVYALKTADPDAAVKVLEALLPTGRFVRDPKANQISAYATPTQQEAVKRVVEQLQAAAQPGEEQTRFEVYQLDDADPRQSLTTLQPLVPNARLSVDAASKKLAVWGTKADHDLLAKAVAQLGRGGGPLDDRQVEVYRLKKADPVAASVVLQNILPKARLSVDAVSRSIIALANLADQKTIRATLDQLEPSQDGADGAEIRLYSLTTADPSSVMSVVQTLFPTAKLVLDSKNRRLAAWTRSADQESIKALIEQMDAEPPGGSKNELMVYPVTSADLSATITTLRTLAPDATLTADSKAGTIVAWARKGDHTKIASALERLQPDDPKSKPRIVAYEVGASDPTVLYPLISTLVPTARVVPNAKNGTIAVWATAADHETIRAAIAEMTKDGPLDAAAKVVVYPLKAAEPVSMVGMLQTLFPGSRFTFDIKNRRLLVFGRPAEQETIKTAIEQMDVQPADEAGRQLAVYPIVGADPTATMTMLRTLVPQTTLTNDTRAGTILAWGPQAELDKIAPALEQMQAKGDPKLRSRIVSYSTAPSDPATLYPLVSALVPTARVVPNAKAGSIAVWATPEEHETIRAAIDEMTSKGTDANAPKVVVYTLKSTSAANVVSALTTAVPEARLGVSQNSRKLVAWARPADHETIRQALVELDTEETERTGAVLKAYLVTNADVSSLLATLQSLFGSRREVRLSLDSRNNKIVALATPSQHEAIRGVIEEIERGSPLDAGSQLEVHALRNADPEVVMQVLTNLVTKHSRALLSVDAKAKTLIAVAPQEQQATIRSTIERLQSTPRQLEVFQLELVEPLTAETAIEKLFAETAGGGKSGLAPSVESDVASQRLFVRGNAEQLAQIRDLLVKMGETNLVAARDGSVRVIHFAGDTKEALAEIQRVWPQLSKSPLRIVRPGEVPLRLRSKLPGGKAGDLKPADPAAKPVVPPAPPADEQQPKDKHTRVDSRLRSLEVKTAAQEDELAPPATEESPREEPTEPKPILVAPGDDKITIMSDDPEAIEQFEALLRALAPPAGAMGRDVMVYPLRSASSTTVAELLNRLFRKSGFGFSDSSVVIEADQRLNAIIVYGGRNDRTTIERLLKLLDSEDVPESLVANRPTLIPVKNTSASRLERVISDIYKTQLTSGGVKQQIPVPSGATRDVAAVIQQINTAASGPMMTLGVDDTTNSIVVMAPGPLLREVKELVAELDEAALHDTSRGVRIVKLKSTNAMRVKEILDSVIRDATRRRGSGSNRP
jgi:type II secretory pathway component GspD/PulD (secretin)